MIWNNTDIKHDTCCSNNLCSLLLTQHKTGLLSCLIWTVETALFTPVGSSALNSAVRTGLKSTVDNNVHRVQHNTVHVCSEQYCMFRPVDNLQQVVRFYAWRVSGWWRSILLNWNSTQKTKNVVIGYIYRHPFNDRAQFLDILEDKMIKLNKKGREIFILGGINIDFFKID